jgi:hypothetical protein
VLRVPLPDGTAWFKACRERQAFEPRLTAGLSARWPDRIPAVLGHDQERAWLLLGDAGAQLWSLGNPPERWEAALPRYAELQRGEAAHALDHLAHGVPDLRVATVPSRYDDLLRHDLPIAPADVARLRAFAPRLEQLCSELASLNMPETVQHDDLHMANVYADGNGHRFLDWGDSSISHPFATLVVTFRFLEELNGLPPGDPWFDRLRDAYLEPWGAGHEEAFELAMTVGAFAHAIASLGQRSFLRPHEAADHDDDLRSRLERALRRTA